MGLIQEKTRGQKSRASVPLNEFLVPARNLILNHKVFEFVNQLTRTMFFS
jgi:hypothetical protein